LAIAKPTALDETYGKRKPLLMAHHYFLMHDPNDFQEIEYLGPTVVQKLQYEFFLNCNSYEIILKKFDFNAITQVHRMKFYYLMATNNSSMAIKFNISLKNPNVLDL